MRDIRELKYMQSLPLEQKIEMTAERIDGWYEHFDGNVAVSFSGGKDSTVLLDIARNHWRGHKDIEAVYVDTGLEYPEKGGLTMQNDMRNRLANLICEAEEKVNNEYPTIEMVAEHLIANGVIVLPCKVGDMVYVLEYEDDCVDYSGYIFIMANNDFAFLSPIINGERNPIEICNVFFDRYINFDDNSGIIVPLNELYLTKKEAEAKLKELNEK